MLNDCAGIRYISKSCIQGRTWHLLPAWKLLQEKMRILGSQMRCWLHVHYWVHTDHNPILHLGSHQEFAVEMKKAQSSCPTVFKCHGQICAVRTKKKRRNQCMAYITIPVLFHVWLVQKMCRHRIEISISGWFVRPPSCSTYDLLFHPLKKEKEVGHFVAFCGILWHFLKWCLYELVFVCVHWMLNILSKTAVGTN